MKKKILKLYREEIHINFWVAIGSVGCNGKPFPRGVNNEKFLSPWTGLNLTKLE